MNSNIKYYVVLILAWLVSGWSLPVMAAMYKWQDENGQWQYSQQPPASGNVEKIQPPPPPPSTVAAEQKALEEQLQQSAEANKQALKSAKTAEYLAEMAQQKKKNCEAAQNNLKVLSQGGGRRIFKNEKGEPEYFTDDEIQARQAEAKQQIQQFCEGEPNTAAQP